MDDVDRRRGVQLGRRTLFGGVVFLEALLRGVAEILAKEVRNR